MNPENTTARDALLHLFGLMSEGQDGYILDMEAAGQQQLVASDVLPTEAPWDDLVALGFTKGDLVEGDPMFTTCTLPAGWSKRPSDHSMWSYVVDERGIDRVGIFYKAAFYDRTARAHINNVSSGIANTLIYGEGPLALPDTWAVYTDDERAGVVTVLLQRMNDWGDPQFHHIYGERLEKCRAAIELVKAAL